MARRYLEEFDKGSHSVYLLYYHLVVVTKYRAKVLREPVRDRIRHIFEFIGQKYGVTLGEFGGAEDHLHFLITAKPTTDLSAFIKAFKSYSSRKIKEDFMIDVNVQEGGINTSLWSPGYCLLTTGGAPIDVIKRYIENQGKE